MLSFPHGASVAGVPVSTLKTILRSIENTRSLSSAIRLKTAAACMCDNAIAVEVAIAGGLIDPETASLTSLGYAVMGSSSKGGLSRTMAKRLLGKLLESAFRYNQSPDRHNEIEQIWLFGSLTGDADIITGIDIAIRWASVPNASLEELDEKIVARFRKLYPEMGGIETFDMAKILQDHDLFGKNHNSLSAVHDLDTLIAMAEPCMMVFSRPDGIVPAPVLLDKHPEAVARPDNIRPLATPEDRNNLLILQPPLRPMPASWSCHGNGYWTISPHPFAGDPAMMGYNRVHELVHDFRNHRRRDLWVYTHEHSYYMQQRRLPALPASFDGRETALIVTDYKWLTVRREMNIVGPGTLAYNISLADYGGDGVSIRKLPAMEQRIYEDLIGYFMATLVYADTLCIKALGPAIEMIHFYSDMGGNTGIQNHMRDWTERFVESMPKDIRVTGESRKH